MGEIFGCKKMIVNNKGEGVLENARQWPYEGVRWLCVCKRMDCANANKEVLEKKKFL